MKSSMKFLVGAFGVASLVGVTSAFAQDSHDEHHPSSAPSRGGSSGHYSAPHEQAPGGHSSSGYSHSYSHPSYPSSHNEGNYSRGTEHGYSGYHGSTGYSGSEHGYSGYHGSTGYSGSEHGYSNYRSPTMRSEPSEAYRGHGYAPPVARGAGRGPSVAFRTFSGFRGRNVAALSMRDRGVWRGGAWRHTTFRGRYGWWWNVNGAWFFYNEPVYPYPDYISDYAYDDYDSDYGYNQYGSDVAYYCSWPQGYYPDVQWCSAPWQPVPMQ